MAAKQKKRRKPKKRIFYGVYFFFVLLCIGVIVLAMRMLWDYAEDYEASMPKYVAEEVGDRFVSRDFDFMYMHDNVSGCEAEGQAAYVAYMQRLTQGSEITWKEKFSANADEKVYQVKYGDRKLAEFTLGKSEEKTEHGNDQWQLRQVQSFVLVEKEYFITVPETSRVYADGQLLGEESVVERGLELTEGYLPAGYSHTKWQTYRVARYFSYPKFTVEDDRGRAQSIIPGKGDHLTVRVDYDDAELRPVMEERVFSTARAFAMFTSDDYSTSGIMKFMLPGSNAETYMRSFDGGWFMPHRDIHFENMRSEKYVQYAEDMFGCEVYFDYLIEYRKETEIYPTGYLFFFKKQGDEWLLFDFSTAG